MGKKLKELIRVLLATKAKKITAALAGALAAVLAFVGLEEMATEVAAVIVGIVAVLLGVSVAADQEKEREDKEAAENGEAYKEQ